MTWVRAALTRLVAPLKPAFHDADTDNDILARIVARMSSCRSACRWNDFGKSRVTDVRMHGRVGRVGVGVGVVECEL